MNKLTEAIDTEEYEALLQFLYMAPVGLAQLAADGAILMLNPLAAQLLMPLSADGELANLFDALAGVAPDLRARCADFRAPHGHICDAMRLYVHADAGGSGPQVLSLSILKLDGARHMAVLSDVTEQDRRERLLRKTDAWLNAIMTNIADYALVSLDASGCVEAWNDSIGRVTGFSAEQVRGQSYALFDPEDGISAAQRRERLRDADCNGWTLDEGWRRRADGTQFWGSTLISPLPGRAEQSANDDAAYCMIIRDISDKREISESLRQATYCDHLTGLANRRAFFEAAELELARRPAPAPLALLVVDADHFKRINDTYGHPAGDAVLRHLAAVMRRVCRGVDVIARMGGEEFAILLPAVDAQGAAAVAERLRAEVAQAAPCFERQAIPVTVSIGVAAMDAAANTIDALIQRADQALYRAKRGGRNRVACWFPADESGQASRREA